MTQSQHTPGPWVIGDIRGLSADGIPIKAYNRAYDDYHAILNITTPHTGDAVANAHIISAAPDMLEALEGVLHHNDAVKEAYKLPNSLVRKIVSALVKAKGYPADGVRGDVAQ